ncbi:nucleoside diphosphate kinase [Cokeromyces recurvatus]|uniref:nucleoside diphosphate kinase n=1 Tax=Cokeromyces recurvatus TaxID=90255 RepID=UPI002220B5CD|nr:nucleoside diphosphate kinase [Cokeromyces recurvatus]KAI7899876.1 nucleoside diphosphate kinase [Cokeromyces recurvatus]
MPVINYYNKPHDWTVAVIKPDGMKHQKEILSIIQDNGFKIIRDKILHISRVQVREWYADKQNEPYYPDLEAYLTRDKIRVLQLERPEAIESLRHLIGPTDPKKAQKLAPKSIRALYGTNIQENAIHASDSKISAEKEFSLLF